MTIYTKTMREALQEIDEAGKQPRQLKDPKTELMISKGDTTIVIDKKDWSTYKAKGWQLAEEVSPEISNKIIDLLEDYVELKEFTSSQMAVLKKEYGPLKGKLMSGDQIKKMSQMLARFDNARLKQLADSDIPMLSNSAKTELVLKRGFKWSDWRRPLDMDYKPEQIDEGLRLDHIRHMTRRNDHFGARIYVAQQMRDGELADIYLTLETIHKKYGSYVGNNAVITRDKLEKVLYSKINGKWGTKLGKDIIGNL